MEEKTGEGTQRRTLLLRVETKAFTAVKVPMQYPLVLLVKVGFK
jgi:hypothetical protein